MSKPAPAAEPEAEEAAPPKPRGKRLPKILAIVAGLGLVGGAAGFYFTRGHEGPATPEAVKEHPPIYVPLETFTVNLQPEAGDQFLQVNMSLKVADDATVEAVKLRMPEVRNRLLLLLSTRKASELISAEGKEKLSQDIRLQVGHIVAPDKVPAVPIGGAAPVPAAAASPAPGEAAAAPVPTEAATPAPPALPTPIGTASAAPVAAPVAAPGTAGPAAHAGTAAAKPSAEQGPIEGVLFTSFIIQ